jgi:hypothetical protein
LRAVERIAGVQFDVHDLLSIRREVGSGIAAPKAFPSQADNYVRPLEVSVGHEELPPIGTPAADS